MTIDTLAERIASARDLDEVMLDLSDAVRAACGAERATIYALGDDRASLVSKIRSGTGPYTQLKLPISAHSIAGYVALARRPLNLRDVYDEAELRSHAQELRFQVGVDRRTGYRTREMLAVPVMREGAVLGVLQLINNRHGGPFGEAVVAAAQALCGALAGALQRLDSLAPAAPGPSARASARALADGFAVPYIAYDARRPRPAAFLRARDREDAATSQWLALAASAHSVFVVCIDPEQTRAGGAVRTAFPHLKPVYCVTTPREFAAMLEDVYGENRPAEDRPTTLPEARRAELIGMVTAMVAGTAAQAARHEVSNLRIDTSPGEREGEIRFTVSGVIHL